MLMSAIVPLRPLRLIGAALLLALCLGWAWRAARPGVSLEYEVAPTTDGIEVRLQVSGLDPRQPLTLVRLAPVAGAPLSDFRVEDGAGRALATTQEGPAAHRGEWRLPTVPGSVVVARYRVTAPPTALPGMSPRARGSAQTSRWSMMRGRDLFVFPAPAERVTHVGVRFHLEDGVRALAPWLEEHYESRAVHQPQGGLEGLIATPIGFGKFTERGFHLAGTRYRLWCEADVPERDASRIESDLRSVAGSLSEAFGRPLGPTYSVIVTPAVDAVGSPLGEAWGSGQGAAVWPLTTTSLRQLARGLADAYLLARPHRFELDDPRESWIAPSLRNLLADRAVARARGVSVQELDRVLAYRYAIVPETSPEVLDLERITTPFPVAEDEAQAVEQIGPYVLARLDRSLPAGKSGASPLTRAVKRAAAHDHVPSLWSLFEPEDQARLADYRARYVRGREVLDPAPDRDSLEIHDALVAAPPPARHARLAVTGQTFGYLEPCGCKVNQAGGVAKRARLIANLRSRTPGLIVLDAGSSFSDPAKIPVLDDFATAEQVLFLRTVESMGYDALAPGFTEVTRGPIAATSLRDASGLPYVCANLTRDGRPLAAPARIVGRAGFATRIVGVYEPPMPFQRASALDAALDSLEMTDPVAAVKRAVRGASASELVVVLGEVSYRTARAIARDCPEVDLIVTGPPRIRGELTPRGGFSSLTPESGFLSNTYVLYTDFGEYGVESLDLGLSAEGRVVCAHLDAIDLGEDVREDPNVRAQLDRFYASAARSQLASAAVEVPFSDDPARAAGGYVGRQACVTCHAQETAQWETTAHAHAFKTLLDVHRHYQPRCVACHVVGLGTAGGYSITAPSRGLADVQCESCHGPGAAHVRDPRRGTIAGPFPDLVFLACPPPEHSEAFVYADRLPRVAHGKSVAARPSAERVARR